MGINLPIMVLAVTIIQTETKVVGLITILARTTDHPSSRWAIQTTVCNSLEVQEADSSEDKGTTTSTIPFSSKSMEATTPHSSGKVVISHSLEDTSETKGLEAQMQLSWVGLRTVSVFLQLSTADHKTERQ